MPEPTLDDPAASLIDAYLDGVIDEPGFAALRIWLAADESHARLFAERSLLHRHSIELACEANANATASARSPGRITAIPAGRPAPIPTLHLPRWTWGLAAVAAMLALAVMSASLPALKAARVDPVETLKSE